MLLIKRHNHKLAGVIQIILSSLWTFSYLSIIYEYRVHPNALRLFWIPEWILVVQAIIGLIGIITGLLVYKKKLKVKTGDLTIGLMWLIGVVAQAQPVGINPTEAGASAERRCVHTWFRM